MVTVTTAITEDPCSQVVSSEIYFWSQCLDRVTWYTFFEVQLRIADDLDSFGASERGYSLNKSSLTQQERRFTFGKEE